MSVFRWLKQLFAGTRSVPGSSLESTTSETEESFVWCLVGNIVDMYNHPVNGTVQRGTKHFSPGTKVYCLPIGWGDGYVRIRVIGKHRKTGRSVLMILETKFITNWRLQQVYHPHVLRIMKEKYGWTSKERDKATILEMLEWLPERTIKPA
mgnify:CR=1 FL=1